MNDIVLELAISAELAGRTLSKAAVGAILDELQKFDSRAVCDALRRCRREQNSFPTIAQIISYVEGGKNNAELIAVDVATRILAARSKYGWCNPEAAKENLGDFAWQVVKNFGGWRTICETQSDQDGTLRAQIRQSAHASLVLEGRRPESQQVITQELPPRLESMVGKMLPKFST